MESILNIVTSGAIIWMTFGVVLGLIFGAIPGLTATLAVVLLVPYTYGMEVTSGMATLIGAYVGGLSGGLVSAIMLNMPGTPASLATTWDGFPLAKQGKAGKALGVAVICSFLGTSLSWLALITLAPLLSRVALQFGPIEYSAAMIFGFTSVITLSGDNVLKGIISAFFGLSLTIIGFDPTTGVLRVSRPRGLFAGGFDFIPALIGLFVITEIFSQLENIDEEMYVVPKQKMINMYMTLNELKQSFFNIIRSAAIGIGIGILPGIGASFSNIVAYDVARKSSKHPETFGKGNIQGIVASEASNNATIGGALIPMVSLGIPGDSVAAALLGGLMIKGITPGPFFARDNPEVLFTIYNSVLLSSFIMLIFMYVIGLRFFPKVLRLPKYCLIPLVFVMALSGSYNINYSIRDVMVALIMGFVGYGMDKFKFPKTPVVITMVLGSSFERYFRNGMDYFDGSLLPFITRPYALVFTLLSIFALSMPAIKYFKKRGII